MSLIRDEDRCHRINGIIPVVSSLSFCYHRLLAGVVRLQHCAEFVLVSVALPSPLRGRWDCVPYMSECAHFSVQVYYCRRSRFEQSCKPTNFCKAETIGSQRMTEPTRRRQRTKCEGYNRQSLEQCKTSPKQPLHHALASKPPSRQCSKMNTL